MTDPAAPQGRPSPGAPVGPTPPAAKKPGGRGALIIVGLLVVFLAVVLFVVRNNVAAGDLKVGDCFDIPNGTTVRTVQSRPCAESHHAEVIFVGEYDGGVRMIDVWTDEETYRSFQREHLWPTLDRLMAQVVPLDAPPPAPFVVSEVTGAAVGSAA